MKIFVQGLWHCGCVISTSLASLKNNVTAYDVEKDFLLEYGNYDYIITNPPFSIAYEFVQKAKQVATKKFAFLLPFHIYMVKKDMMTFIWTKSMG